MVLDMLLMQLQRVVVKLAQLMDRHHEIRNQRVAAAAREVLAHDHAHHLQLVGVRRHRVGRHDPAALAQMVGDGEFVEFVAVGGVEAEGDEGEAVATGFGHEDEAHFLDRGGEVVGGAGEVDHDGAVATFAKTDHLVVLAHDLGSAAGEVEGEGGLIGAEVVDVEDELF